MNDEGHCGTYETTAVTKDWVGGDGMQHIDDRCEPFEQLGIAVFEFIKCLGLGSEYMEDRIGAVAAINPVGEIVVAEIFPSLLGVLRQGSVEEGLKVGGREGHVGRQGHGIMGGKSDASSGREGG